MKAFVTGANGFMGSAVVRRLLEHGQEVKALVRKGSDMRNLHGLPIEVVNGDLTDYDSILGWMGGCQTVYHLAAKVYFWVPPAERESFYEVNVGGTKNVFAAAQKLRIERVVYTSTISCIGAYGREHPTTEEHAFNLWDMSMDYERSKYLAEFEAWRFAARGLPLVVVLPTAPLGPRDLKPNPIGKLILDFIARRVPGYIDGGGNFIDVDDLAEGHVLAGLRGKVGERYILGGENLETFQLFRTLEAISGVRAPRFKLPYRATLGLAYFLKFWSDHFTHKHPLITPPLVKFSSKFYFADTSKAARELGFRPASSVRNAAVKAIEWFLANGYVPGGPRKRDRIQLRLANALSGCGG